MGDNSGRTRRAVIFTALDLEYEAVREHLSDPVELPPERGTIYEQGRFVSDTQAWDVFIAQVGMGNAATAVEAERAIRKFDPEVMLFVGVAGSLKPDDAGLGDVVAATKVYRYHSGKAGDTFLARPEVDRASHALAQRAQAVARNGTWVQRIKGDSPPSPPKAKTGALAAGEQVVSSLNSGTARLIGEHYSDAIAIEMEGSGFLAAAYANAAVDALVVRGISDLVAGKVESDRGGWQPIAARHAAAFAFDVLARYPSRDSTTTSPRVHSIPHLRNPNFTGREGLLDNLHTALTSGEVTALTQPQAIHGLGGIGKTQIAVEYAYRHESEYDIVWWVRAEEPAVLASDYAALANHVGLAIDERRDQSQIVEITRRWLEQNGRWLLILDNAPDFANVRDYLPRSGNGHVLITSRNATRWGDGAHPISVASWEIEEAAAFLLMRTGQSDEASAIELAVEMGHLPLALAQAGAYIDETGITIAEYTELFRTRRAQILSRGQPSDYPDTVATTWDISFDRVGATSPGAADLLNLCAFFAPDDIPRDLLIGGATHLPEPVAAIVADPSAFNDVIALTRRFSLLEVRQGSALSMHRLVQFVTRSKVGDDASKWAEASVRLVSATFPGDLENDQSWPLAERLLPHALTVIQHSRLYGTTPVPICVLMHRVGLYFRAMARYPLARTLFETSLRMAEEIYGVGDLRTGPYVNDYGIVLLDLGDYATALYQFERSLAIDRDAFGQLNHSTARDLSNKGTALQYLGDLEGAKNCFEESLDIDRHVLESNDPLLSTTLSNLVLRHGDFDEARLLR